MTPAFALAAVLAGVPADSTRALVAVAANFAPVMEQLRTEFATRTGYRLDVSIGSTGALYAQIVHGAPFDVFLSADVERVARLEREGRAVAGSRFTYAVGRLALWSPGRALAASPQEALARGDFRRLAIALPSVAPYGDAARAVLVRLGLWDGLQPKIVRGESIAQTYQFVATGNAELGFVALAQVIGADPSSYWRVPADLHAPIEQQAVLLVRAADNPAATAFVTFLTSEPARAIIRAAGYDAPEGAAARDSG